MKEGDPGIVAEHRMTGHRHRAGVELADKERRQQCDTKGAADQAKEQQHRQTDAGVGYIERVLDRDDDRRQLKPEGEAEPQVTAVSNSVDLPSP